ncbi:uncharacterized protein (DUF362 family) [Hydrogenispora ethanolica]|uniref:Uncharacterized protein (DUF362 family) n=1 Tax=Hydrogenispora ethanolica TaxID=1082276 RepID=A0A4R1R967_HYDET|nr:DUF362 domain-containing protein [Hydrogenispora ethanolica]TCL62178.1 uncharacterized protein (DUF362 family) [Hydrogenispora ethanolica]
MERVSLLQCESYGTGLKSQLEKLLAPLGGLGSFFRPGDRVLLKPNLIGPRSVESAATTHPALILAMAELVKDCGGRVGVGDSPGIGSAESVIKRLGMEAALKRLGAAIVEFNTPVALAGFGRELPFERRYKNLFMARELDDFDQLINLAKLKSHGQMGVTLATKNLFGCVVGTNKGRWHFNAGKDLDGFARLLLEIALTARPGLHIVDGIIGMDGNGPSNGRPRQLNILAAGGNPLALDRVIVELLQKRPEQFPLFAAARALGLPGLELAEIAIAGAGPETLRVEDFQIPAFHRTHIFVNETFSRIASGLLKQRMLLDEKACVNCRKCEELCPARAISYAGRIRIDDSQCIQCCCCQEMCPVGALRVSEPFTVKLLRKLKIM